MAGATASPCDGCDARCCRSYTVYVTGEDAFRIASGTGLPMVRFLGHVQQGERSDMGFLLEPGGVAHDLVLDQAPSPDPLKPCLFLRVGDGGTGRCGVYPIRPGACRRFPAVRLGGGVGPREGIVCPEGAWEGHPMDRLSWRIALEREQRERELYAVVVSEWNARVEASGELGPRTFEAYLDHLSDAYRWISGMRRMLRPRDRAGPALLLRVGEGLRAFPASAWPR
jgi:Fe-S-cluster containining protein